MRDAGGAGFGVGFEGGGVGCEVFLAGGAARYYEGEGGEEEAAEEEGILAAGAVGGGDALGDGGGGRRRWLGGLLMFLLLAVLGPQVTGGEVLVPPGRHACGWGGLHVTAGREGQEVSE